MAIAGCDIHNRLCQVLKAVWLSASILIFMVWACTVEETSAWRIVTNALDSAISLTENKEAVTRCYF